MEGALLISLLVTSVTCDTFSVRPAQLVLQHSGHRPVLQFQRGEIQLVPAREAARFSLTNFQHRQQPFAGSGGSAGSFSESFGSSSDHLTRFPDRSLGSAVSQGGLGASSPEVQKGQSGSQESHSFLFSSNDSNGGESAFDTGAFVQETGASSLQGFNGVPKASSEPAQGQSGSLSDQNGSFTTVNGVQQGSVQQFSASGQSEGSPGFGRVGDSRDSAHGFSTSGRIGSHLQTAGTTGSLQGSASLLAGTTGSKGVAQSQKGSRISSPEASGSQGSRVSHDFSNSASSSQSGSIAGTSSTFSVTSDTLQSSNGSPNPDGGSQVQSGAPQDFRGSQVSVASQKIPGSLQSTTTSLKETDEPSSSAQVLSGSQGSGNSFKGFSESSIPAGSLQKSVHPAKSGALKGAKGPHSSNGPQLESVGLTEKSGGSVQGSLLSGSVHDSSSPISGHGSSGVSQKTSGSVKDSNGSDLRGSSQNSGVSSSVSSLKDSSQNLRISSSGSDSSNLSQNLKDSGKSKVFGGSSQGLSSGTSIPSRGFTGSKSSGSSQGFGISASGRTPQASDISRPNIDIQNQKTGGFANNPGSRQLSASQSPLFRSQFENRKSDDKFSRGEASTPEDPSGSLFRFGPIPTSENVEDVKGVFEPLNLPSGSTLLLGQISGAFSCIDLPYGYYADQHNSCRIFHICYPALFTDGRVETYQYSFLCGGGTVFDQKEMTCAHEAGAIPCNQSPDYYYKNTEFGLPEERAQF